MLSRIALSILTAAGLLLCAEWATRSFQWAPQVYQITTKHPESTYTISDDPIYGYELKKNYRSPQPDFHDNLERTNSLGLRGAEISYSKPNGVLRIALVGDSIVMGYTLPEHLSLPPLLENLLAAEYPDKRFQVINCAVTGYATRAEAKLLRERCSKYQLDLAIVLFVQNDFDNFHGPTREKIRVDRPAFLEQLFLRSAAFRFLALRLNLFHFRAEFEKDYFQKRNLRANGENGVQQGIAELANISTTNNLPIVILAWPEFLPDEIYYPSFTRVSEQSQTLLIEEYAKQHPLKVRKLDTLFLEDFKNKRQKSIFTKEDNLQSAYVYSDRMHLSAKGSPRAAGVILQAVRPEISSLVERE